LHVITKDERENLTKTELMQFFFTVHESSQKIIEAARKTAIHYRNSMCKFYVMYSDGEEKLEVSNKANETSYFKGNLENEEEIKYFAYVHMYPFFSALNKRYAAFAIEEKQPFLSYIASNEDFGEEKLKMILDTLNELADHIPVFYTNCSDFEFLCRYTRTFKEGNSEKMTNRLIVWHKTEGLFWTKDEIYNKSDTVQWIKDILADKIKGRGPGNDGIFSSIMSQVYESYADGPGSFAMIISLPFMVCFCIYLIISSCLNDTETKTKTE
jgi:hypothetical protein